MAVGREQRLVFGEVAETYDRLRPRYPEALVDDVLDLGGVLPGDRALEVGAGTGQATVPFALRGLRVLALEPSPEMAEVLRRTCRSLPDVSIVQSTFEEWPLEAGAFGLVYAAQSWHWVSPEVGLDKAAAALRPGGALALFRNRVLWRDGRLRRALQEVYERRAPGLLAARPGFPGLGTRELDDRWAEQLEACGRFGSVRRRRYAWSTAYRTQEYLELLQTQSDHRMLPDDERAALLGEVGGLLDREGGELEVAYRTKLVLARRRGRPRAEWAQPRVCRRSAASAKPGSAWATRPKSSRARGASPARS